MRRDRSADADPVSVFEEGAVHGDTSDEERACERQGELLREDAEGHLTREAADWWARYRAWRERRRRLLREQQERALEREWRRAREAFAPAGVPADVDVRWGLAGDEEGIAELLELNGVPRWVAFEERFIVAEAKPEGRVLAAVRYGTDSERLLLGLLVADPWRGERRLAAALYAGAADLAREMGVREVLARPPAFQETYPGDAGYRRRGRYRRLDVDTPPPSSGERPDLRKGWWRSMVALWGYGHVPFFRSFRD